MYGGLTSDQCEWAAADELDARIADMRQRAPHVVALIATWLNMVFIQSPEGSTQQVYLTLVLMRYATLRAAETTKADTDKLSCDPLQRLYKDSAGQPRILNVFNNCYGCHIGVWLKDYDPQHRGPGPVDKGRYVDLSVNDHTVEMKPGNLADNFDADVDDLRTVSYEGDVRSFTTANAISKDLVEKGPFKRNTLADRQFMYHSFFGEKTRVFLTLQPWPGQALLAASVDKKNRKERAQRS